VSPDELAKLTSRNVVTIRKRLCQFRTTGHLAAVEGINEHVGYFEEIRCAACGNPNLVPRVGGKIRPSPNFHFLTPKGEREALKYVPRVAAAWADKSRNIVDHDRGITLCHLSFHNGFGTRVGDWRQQRDEVKETATVDGERVNFYADARFTLDGTTFWLEYCLAHPSSKRGETDIMLKVKRYNALITAHKKAHHADPGRVLFVFKEKSHVKPFLDRVSDDYPFLWCMVSDIESVKHHPTGAIWWTPKDFDSRTHGLIPQAE